MTALLYRKNVNANFDILNCHFSQLLGYDLFIMVVSLTLDTR